jgi:hypothetical protein
MVSIPSVPSKITNTPQLVATLKFSNLKRIPILEDLLIGLGPSGNSLNVRSLPMANSKKEDQKKLVEAEIPLDTEKLYASLPEAIAYLQQIAAQHSDKPDLHIDEHWTGYEDMELRFAYNRLETDEEFKSRLEIEAAEAKRHSEMLREAQRRKDIEAQIERLRKQL